MAKKPRVNKRKKDIVSDMQLVESANRRRALIRDVIFPYLVELNEDIAYSKVFVQAMAGLIEGVLEDSRKKTTIGDLNSEIVAKLQSIFAKSDPEQLNEYHRWIGLVDRMHEVSIQDFAYAAELPRYIDGYIAKTNGKNPISTISIDEILG